jgi:type VI secretion system protein ImpH
MDAQERDPRAPLSDGEAERLEVARRRGFGPLMLLVERLRPDHPDVGGAAAPHEEAVRFRHDPSLAFSTSDVTSVRSVARAADPHDLAPRAPVLEITTTFLGLTGAVSPLPGFFAEEVAQEVAQASGDPARRREFLDLFHHRILSLFHRAATAHDPAATWRSDASDAWSSRILALAGLDVAGGGLPDVPAWRLLRWAPLLAGGAVTAAGLEAALADALAAELGGARVTVEQFVGTWVPIAPEDRTRLGVAGCALGRSTLLGARVFDRAGKIRIVVGPLDRAGYDRFRDPELRDRLERCVRALVPEGLDHEVALELEPDAAPPPVLSAAGTFRLGRNVWLGRQRSPARLAASAGG